MTHCIVCHASIAACDRCGGDGCSACNSADQWCCRECQRDPMPQLRAHLERARVSGMPFDTAWPWALERVKWPHATEHRKTWKWLLGLEVDGTVVQARTNARILLAWKAAYERQQPEAREDALQRVEPADDTVASRPRLLQIVA